MFGGVHKIFMVCLSGLTYFSAAVYGCVADACWSHFLPVVLIF
jgi:hypothetical protein